MRRFIMSLNNAQNVMQLNGTSKDINNMPREPYHNITAGKLSQNFFVDNYYNYSMGTSNTFSIENTFLEDVYANRLSASFKNSKFNYSQQATGQASMDNLNSNRLIGVANLTLMASTTHQALYGGNISIRNAIAATAGAQDVDTPLAIDGVLQYTASGKATISQSVFDGDANIYGYKTLTIIDSSGINFIMGGNYTTNYATTTLSMASANSMIEDVLANISMDNLNQAYKFVSAGNLNMQNSNVAQTVVGFQNIYAFGSSFAADINGGRKTIITKNVIGYGEFSGTILNSTGSITLDTSESSSINNFANITLTQQGFTSAINGGTYAESLVGNTVSINRIAAGNLLVSNAFIPQNVNGMKNVNIQNSAMKLTGIDSIGPAYFTGGDSFYNGAKKLSRGNFTVSDSTLSIGVENYTNVKLTNVNTGVEKNQQLFFSNGNFTAMNKNSTGSFVANNSSGIFNISGYNSLKLNAVTIGNQSPRGDVNAKIEATNLIGGNYALQSASANEDLLLFWSGRAHEYITSNRTVNGSLSISNSTINANLLGFKNLTVSNTTSHGEEDLASVECVHDDLTFHGGNTKTVLLNGKSRDYDLYEYATGKATITDSTLRLASIIGYQNLVIKNTLFDKSENAIQVVGGNTLNGAVIKAVGSLNIQQSTLTADINGFAKVNLNDVVTYEKNQYINVKTQTLNDENQIRNVVGTLSVLNSTFSGKLEGFKRVIIINSLIGHANIKDDDDREREDDKKPHPGVISSIDGHSYNQQGTIVSGILSVNYSTIQGDIKGFSKILLINSFVSSIVNTEYLKAQNYARGTMVAKNSTIDKLEDLLNVTLDKSVIKSATLKSLNSGGKFSAKNGSTISEALNNYKNVVIDKSTVNSFHNSDVNSLNSTFKMSNSIIQKNADITSYSNMSISNTNANLNNILATKYNDKFSLTSGKLIANSVDLGAGYDTLTLNKNSYFATRKELINVERISGTGTIYLMENVANTYNIDKSVNVIEITTKYAFDNSNDTLATAMRLPPTHGEIEDEEFAPPSKQNIDWTDELTVFDTVDYFKFSAGANSVLSIVNGNTDINYSLYDKDKNLITVTNWESYVFQGATSDYYLGFTLSASSSYEKYEFTVTHNIS